MNTNILTVSQLNFYLKSIIDEDEKLNNIYIKGEISNLSNYNSKGHNYFSLKDDKALINCVIFSGTAKNLRVNLKNGMNVLLRGNVSIYETSGIYQFYVRDVQPIGLGNINISYEELKTKLQAEGLFEKENKKPLPNFPQKIGVITSETGAVIHDITNVINRRFPIAQVIISPVAVQGEEAPKQIIEALKLFNLKKCADVLIVGRGGGSNEDLDAFNDEGLARAIFNSEIPVVSAVGHETDFTICDFVSDLRAPTPSAAAEIITPDIDDIYRLLDNYKLQLKSIITNLIDEEKFKINILKNKLHLISPSKLTLNKKEKIKFLNKIINEKIYNTIRSKQAFFSMINSKLIVLNPTLVLKRGYSIMINEKSKCINSIKKVKVGENIKVKVFDGTINCEVLNLEEEN